MMTTVGRGRGNWGDKDFAAPLRRPGDASRTSSGEEDSIITQLTNLDLNEHHKFESLEEQIKKYCDNREHLWKITKKLYDCSLKDRNMGEKVLKLWKDMSNLEVNEVKLRSVIMSTAQMDFEEREEIHKDDSKRFLNSVALFGGIFHYMTLPGGKPFTVLVNPLIEYLQLLLQECSNEISRREAELEMVAVQLNLNGHFLKVYAEDSLAKFTLQIRTVLAGSLPSIKCHYWLLLILDLANHGWNHQGFPSYLNSFYSEKLGKSFDQLPVIDIPSSSSEVGSNKNIHKNKVKEIPGFVRRQENKFSQEQNTLLKDGSYDKPSRRNWPDGNGEQQERRKPPYWGHDDRFDKQGGSYTGEGHGHHGVTERGGRRGSGGRGNWRGRGEGRPRREIKDNIGSMWRDETPRDNPQSEESW